MYFREKRAAVYRNIHCWDPYNDYHQYLTSTAQPQFATPRKAAIQGVTPARSGAEKFKPGDVVVLLPTLPQPAASPTPTLGLFFTTSVSFFFLLLGLQQALEHKAGNRKAGFILWQHPITLKITEHSCGYGSRPVLVSLMALGYAWIYVHLMPACHILLPGTNIPLPLLLVWTLAVPTLTSLQLAVLRWPGSNWHGFPY